MGLSKILAKGRLVFPAIFIVLSSIALLLWNSSAFQPQANRTLVATPLTPQIMPRSARNELLPAPPLIPQSGPASNVVVPRRATGLPPTNLPPRDFIKDPVQQAPRLFNSSLHRRCYVVQPSGCDAGLPWDGDSKNNPSPPRRRRGIKGEEACSVAVAADVRRLQSKRLRSHSSDVSPPVAPKQLSQSSHLRTRPFAPIPHQFPRQLHSRWKCCPL